VLKKRDVDANEHLDRCPLAFGVSPAPAKKPFPPNGAEFRAADHRAASASNARSAGGVAEQDLLHQKAFETWISMQRGNELTVAARRETCMLIGMRA
jgi:hypothetical protein